MSHSDLRARIIDLARALLGSLGNASRIPIEIEATDDDRHAYVVYVVHGSRNRLASASATNERTTLLALVTVLTDRARSLQGRLYGLLGGDGAPTREGG